MTAIKGYTPLDPAIVDCINDFKRQEEILLRAIEELERSTDFDKRWIAIGKTDLQKGFMAIIRGIAQPQRLTDDQL